MTFFTFRRIHITHKCILPTQWLRPSCQSFWIHPTLYRCVGSDAPYAKKFSKRFAPRRRYTRKLIGPSEIKDIDYEGFSMLSQPKYLRRFSNGGKGKNEGFWRGRDTFGQMLE